MEIFDRQPIQHAEAIARTQPVQPPSSRAQSPEEAAAQFEEILVRQFVEQLTDGLFKQSLTGDDGPGWMQGQADMQRDILNDTLAKHLSSSGALRLSDLLLRQWGRQGVSPDLIDTPPEAPAIDAAPANEGAPPARPAADDPNLT